MHMWNSVRINKALGTWCVKIGSFSNYFLQTFYLLCNSLEKLRRIGDNASGAYTGGTQKPVAQQYAKLATYDFNHLD